jgi:hypothetical protein
LRPKPCFSILRIWDSGQILRVHVVAIGADSRIRTDDLIITNDLLYQLSYIGICTTVLSRYLVFHG